jgi:hypothetical protein
MWSFHLARQVDGHVCATLWYACLLSKNVVQLLISFELWGRDYLASDQIVYTDDLQVFMFMLISGVRWPVKSDVHASSNVEIC